MLSIVVPCFNEEKGLTDFFAELHRVMESNEFKYELILVNDGSKDGTFGVLRDLAANNRQVNYISFSRNFGKEAAMLAGLRYAQGEAVVIMDADLQHPPELIPELVAHYHEGFDQVIAKRNRKGDKPLRSYFSKLYYKLINRLVDISLVDGIGDFRLLSRRAVDALLKLEEYNRFSKGLFSWIGFKEYVVEYENVAREAGESKWSFGSLLNYGIDGIISFNNRPLRMAIYIGSLVTLADLLYVIVTFIQIMVYGVDLPGYFTIIATVLMFSGVQLIFLGVIGEYIGRIYYEAKRRPHYIIQDDNMETRKNEHN